MHLDPAMRKEHDEMGFQDGWGAVFDQLVELMSKASESEPDAGAAGVELVADVVGEDLFDGHR